MNRAWDAVPRLAFWLFWPALALVIWGELTPHPPALGEPDKVLHFVAYFGLAAIAALALRKRRAIAAAVLALVFLGGMLEVVQGLVGRDAEWLDEAANTAGAIAGAGLALLFLRLVGARRSE
ncbi:MAG TPA: VanZ family protein [Rhizomicrobium sp.]|jgi:VanZ family protein|nr:VanZ family protein [Rhizomicrobium sp.]